MKERLNIPQIAQLSAGIAKILSDQPRTIGVKATAFFKDNFRRSGFPMNGTLQRWDPRKKPDYRPGGKLLWKSGRLRRSIRTIEATPKRVVVGTDVPYAEIHNDGGDITGVAKVKPFSRKEAKVKGYTRRQNSKSIAIKGHRRKGGDVSAHTRKMNLHFPKRQFIGHSPDLMKSLDREYIKQLRALETKIFTK